MKLNEKGDEHGPTKQLEKEDSIEVGREYVSKERERKCSDDNSSERLGTRRTRTIVDACRDGRRDGAKRCGVLVCAFDVVEQQTSGVPVVVPVEMVVVIVVVAPDARSRSRIASAAALAFQVYRVERQCSCSQYIERKRSNV